MKAIDTNVVVRLLVRDDPEQTRLAADLLKRAPVFLPLTVLLEAEWVMRAVYGWRRRQLNAALQDFLRIDNVHVSHPAEVSEALAAHAAGADLADCLHLVASRGCESFVTFDRSLAKAFANANLPPVEPLS